MAAFPVARAVDETFAQQGRCAMMRRKAAVPFAYASRQPSVGAFQSDQ
jgi:hypothetical protein